MALILTASHDTELMRMVAQSLVRNNHRVVMAPTIQFALDWLNATDTLPDLIIADMGLRDFGGFEFVETVKNTQRWKDVPILAQTKSQYHKVFEHCDGTLQKPYAPQELARIVNLFLQTRGQRAA
jgi:DNA-binding response OmpR family regulator